MSVAALLSIFGLSMLGALIPIVNVELIVIVAARELGSGVVPMVVVSFVAAAGTMVGKLQVYAVARGGRALGGRWVRRRVEKEASEALTQAAARSDRQGADAVLHAAERLEHETAEALLITAELADAARTSADAESAELAAHPELPHSRRRRAWAWCKRMLAGPNIDRLGVPAVLLSALVGIPPFAITAAVAGAGRMRWWVFGIAGLVGRFVRFAIVYEGAARAIGH